MPLLQAPNFLTLAECQAIQIAWDSDPNREVKARRRGLVEADLLQVFPGAADLYERIRQRLAVYFHWLPPITLDMGIFSRITRGGGHSLHADAVVESGAPNHTPHRVVSACLYLNEVGADFDGGTILFPGQSRPDHAVAPRAGLLLGFTTGWDFRHEITTVHRGQRDAVIVWFMDAVKSRS